MASKQPRYTWFGCILYPEEDIYHRLILSSIEEMAAAYPNYLYIRHDPDDLSVNLVDNTKDVPEEIKELLEEKDDSGDFNDPNSLQGKPHYHVLFQTSCALSVNSILARFVFKKRDGETIVALHHVKHIYDHVAYAYYMLHKDPKSRTLQKKEYEFSDLHGNPDFIRKLMKRNLYFVSIGLNYILSYIMEHPDTNNFDLMLHIQTLENSDPVLYQSVMDAKKAHNYSIKLALDDAMRSQYVRPEVLQAIYDKHKRQPV